MITQEFIIIGLRRLWGLDPPGAATGAGVSLLALPVETTPARAQGNLMRDDQDCSPPVLPATACFDPDNAR